jgi:hypothetical protein
MPIPRGAHQVRGFPNRVRLSNGETVTRASALTMGAREMGYRSHNAYRGHATGDGKQFNSWLNTEQGQQALETAKENGLTKNDLKSQFIGARNGRPHPGSGNPGNSSYHAFMEEYDMEDYTEDFTEQSG